MDHSMCDKVYDDRRILQPRHGHITNNRIRTSKPFKGSPMVLTLATFLCTNFAACNDQESNDQQYFDTAPYYYKSSLALRLQYTRA